MTITQIEANLQALIADFTPKTFIYDFLLAYDQPKSTITRLQKGGLNLSKNDGELLWKKKLLFRVAKSENVVEEFEIFKTYNDTKKHEPRFLIITDFKILHAFDAKTAESIDIEIVDLAKHFDFFLPIAGMEKHQAKVEQEADVRAAEKMAKLYDEILKDNPTNSKEEVHNLNVFLSRLLFCYFAEDTGIFAENQFTHALSSHTQTDGVDLANYLDKLFEVLNTDNASRTNLPNYLSDFPYVNGGLFRNAHNAPNFSIKSRKIAIEGGELQWKKINPDIFGSMIQAVITPEHRGGLGMHYTSVPNIMKVIEPLFLNDLHDEFNASKNNVKKLNDLLKRIWNLKIFDPACGSGNFLIIAYKELRRLEMLIFAEIDRINQSYSQQFTGIALDHFYGIEIDDFAHEVAILSLWLAEHQMNQEFFAAFGRSRPALPLKATGNIVHGNATRVDWELVCPKYDGDEIYILGNPPYLGSSMQSSEQKEDMAFVFKGIDGYKNLDFIACWFLKGAKYIQNINAQFAFVSTNSICQGEQVALLWPYIFDKKLEIGFAHTSFKWVNNAKANAAVIVIILGIRNSSTKEKFLFKNNLVQKTSNINAYLISASNILFDRRSNSLSNFPELVRGSMPSDGGNFSLTFEEKEKLISNFPNSLKFIKKIMSGGDFLNDKERFCLWIIDKEVSEARTIPFINERLNAVRDFRLLSDAPTTVEYANFPNRFRQIAYKDSNCIVIPLTSSIRREYIPFSFLAAGTVVTNSAGVIYGAEPNLFSIISSRMHMIWVSIVAGRLKTDYRYSNVICYNNFPFPPITETQKKELEQHTFNILHEREQHSEKTLAQLYDPDKMPDGLREAHHQNDLAIERCYRAKPFESDEERLEYLFKLYEQMIEEEKTRGTLFEGEKKGKKKK